MASLIFWGPYLAHKGIVERKREKQRVKNYERWEGLREDYDEQRKISRGTQSLDIQRTNTNPYEDDRPILTLRDQQEAGDARTGWRPQESWEPPRTQVQAQMTGRMQQTHPQAQRHVSSTPTSGLPLRSQKTGATWDEGLPARMQVSRRSYDGSEYANQYRNASVSPPISRQPSVGRGDAGSISRQQSRSRAHTPSGLRERMDSPSLSRQYTPPDVEISTVQEIPKNEFGFVEPLRQAAGGRMAELIERGY